MNAAHKQNRIDATKRRRARKAAILREQILREQQRAESLHVDPNADQMKCWSLQLRHLADLAT